MDLFQWNGLCLPYVDYFTVPLHSPNGLLLGLCKETVTNVWKKVQITTSHVRPYVPRIQWSRGVSQSVFKWDHHRASNTSQWEATVYPKKYAHGFCFAVLCCGYTLTDFRISIRLTSLALWQSNDCPSASKATLMNMDEYFMWIHYERLHNHNKAKHNKTVCIFLGIYCMSHTDIDSPTATKLGLCSSLISQGSSWTLPSNHGLTHWSL